jgi:hypothetical protein
MRQRIFCVACSWEISLARGAALMLQIACRRARELHGTQSKCASALRGIADFARGLFFVARAQKIAREKITRIFFAR